MQKVGQVFVFIVLVWLAMVAGRAIIKVTDPYTRKLSPSVADFLMASAM